jgi:hypothetical protein
MRTSNLARTITAVATTGLAFGLLTATAGALEDGQPGTLTALHETGCVPVVSLEAGTNTLTYRGDGQTACRGQKATIVYDGNTLTADLVDLGQGSIEITPPCGETHVQTDLFAGDITTEIHTPTWNPAWRLITVSWLDGGACQLPPATSITFQTTPAPAPTFPEPTIPTTVDEPLLPPPSTTTTVVDTPTTTTVTEPTPELPMTGNNPLPTILLGLSLIVTGAALRRYAKTK